MLHLCVCDYSKGDVKALVKKFEDNNVHVSGTAIDSEADREILEDTFDETSMSVRMIVNYTILTDEEAKFLAGTISCDQDDEKDS